MLQISVLGGPKDFPGSETSTLVKADSLLKTADASAQEANRQTTDGGARIPYVAPTPIYKKWWFWAAIGVGAVSVGYIAANAGKKSRKTKREDD